MSNFEFLNEKYPERAKFGEFTEKYILGLKYNGYIVTI